MRNHLSFGHAATCTQLIQYQSPSLFPLLSLFFPCTDSRESENFLGQRKLFCRIYRCVSSFQSECLLCASANSFSRWTLFCKLDKEIPCQDEELRGDFFQEPTSVCGRSIGMGMFGCRICFPRCCKDKQTKHHKWITSLPCGMKDIICLIFACLVQQDTLYLCHYGWNQWWGGLWSIVWELWF